MHTVKKGVQTKARIVEQSAILMNQRGFLSTSLSEIVEATGMQKGGIYNHFKDKEELALQAFDQCCSVVHDYIALNVETQSGVVNRILAFIDAYFSFSENPDIPGGCPIMNAGVEADDGKSPKLLDRAQHAMNDVITFLEEEITTGIRSGVLRADIEPKQAATIIMAMIEGGILLYKLFDDRSYITTVQNHVIAHVQEQLSVSIP